MGPNYDKHPSIPAGATNADCAVGWDAIAARLASASAQLICVEVYPGAFVDELERELAGRLQPQHIFRSDVCFKPPEELERLFRPSLTEDPVFGFMRPAAMRDFFDEAQVEALRRQIAEASGSTVVIGAGASLLAPDCQLLVYADMARWEIQKRQRANEIGNLGAGNACASPAAKYKRAYFVDWRAADCLKRELLPRITFLLDTNDRAEPKLISGDLFRGALARACRQPFRVVPFFDPGPWGGEWMRQTFGLPAGPPNYAWCFDCVPEENSLLLAAGRYRVEIPAIDLVFSHPRELLGDAVFERFGAEFPIRFDLLDTMGGGNLSLQVHPLTGYILQAFGMKYTQDESYYLLDAASDACVYLGLRENVDATRMFDMLEAAQQGGGSFPAERFVNKWPARKHDHFLIPGGTIHCSGRNSVVLEISATPYIFTFKLWDWDRLGLDGKPRPIHLNHGRKNIQWDRTSGWVQQNLVNRVRTIASGEGWREERTGLHESEFIETRRHWFTAPVLHDTKGNLNVLNLVEGDTAVITSPHHAFDPFPLHYAETVIIPANVGAYEIRPAPGSQREFATLKAYVRGDSLEA